MASVSCERFFEQFRGDAQLYPDMPARRDHALIIDAGFGALHFRVDAGFSIDDVPVKSILEIVPVVRRIRTIEPALLVSLSVNSGVPPASQ